MKWKNIFKETFFISSIHLTTKILGFLEKLLIAYVFGASRVSDAYFFTFSVFIIIFDFFNESTSPALLPEYVKSKSLKEKRDLFSGFFTFLILTGFTISLLIYIFSPQIIRSFSDFPPETSKIAVMYLKIISLGIGFVISSISTYLFINSDQKFLPASLGDLMFKVSGSLLILYVFIDKRFGLLPLAIGILIGSVLKLTTHLIWLKRNNLLPSLKLHPDIKRVLKLSAPMVVGILFSKFRIVFDNYLVSGMVVGSVTALQLGYRVMEFGIVVILEPFSTVIFPEFVRLVKNPELFIERISSGIKFLLSIFLPVSILAFIFKTEIIVLLFKRGAFGSEAVSITSSAFSFYALSMSFICIDLLLSRSLFALGDTKFPALFEIGSIVFHIIFSSLFIKSGIHIISLSFLLNRIIKTTLLYVRFRFKTGQHLQIGYYLIRIFLFLSLNTIVVTILKNISVTQNIGIINSLLLSLLFITLYVIQLHYSGILKQLIRTVSR